MWNDHYGATVFYASQSTYFIIDIIIWRVETSENLTFHEVYTSKMGIFMEN